MAKKILVVDDRRESLEMLKDLFETSGYQVVTAPDGIECLEILKERSFNVMFFDLQMPLMNGLELCRKVREINNMAWICAITGDRTLFEISQCREAGFDDYIPKPVDITMLLKLTEEAFFRFDRWKGR